MNMCTTQTAGKHIAHRTSHITHHAPHITGLRLNRQEQKESERRMIMKREAKESHKAK